MPRVVWRVVILVLATLSAAPAGAQQAPGRMAIVGVLGERPGPVLYGVEEGLGQLGWIEGISINVVYRGAYGHVEQFPALAQELVGLPSDVLVTVGAPAAYAMRQATGKTPIIVTQIADPVALGLVRSLAHPDGNITGFTNFDAEIEAKRLELLKEMLPRLSRVAVLANANNESSGLAIERLRPAAAAIGISLDIIELRDQSRLDETLDELRDQHPDAAMVLADIFLGSQSARIAEFMQASRLPAAYAMNAAVSQGGLLSYGTDLHLSGLQAALYVHKVLRGTKVADLPVQQPTRLRLLLNLKTAKEIGLTVPNSLLQRADEVIE